MQVLQSFTPCLHVDQLHLPKLIFPHGLYAKTSDITATLGKLNTENAKGLCTCKFVCFLPITVHYSNNRYTSSMDLRPQIIAALNITAKNIKEKGLFVQIFKIQVNCRSWIISSKTKAWRTMGKKACKTKPEKQLNYYLTVLEVIRLAIKRQQ